MEKMFIFTFAVLMLGTQAFAGKFYPDRHHKQLTVHQASCVKEANAIAMVVGPLVERAPADQIKSFEIYSEVTGEYETREQHVWAGDVELVVTMLPNYFGDGKCQFSSSYIHRD